MGQKYFNRLAIARERAGYTQQQVAEVIGVTTTGYQNWEYGNTPIKASKLRQLTSLLGCTADYLLGIDSAIQPMPTKTYDFPVFGRIAAGTPREALYQSDVSHEITESLYIENQGSFWVVVSGNSMNRVLLDGSLALINPNREVRNGDIALVFVNGDDATLKRVFFEGDAIRLHPESYDPEYRDRVIDSSDPDAPDVRLVGRVVTYTAPDNWRG